MPRTSSSGTPAPPVRPPRIVRRRDEAPPEAQNIERYLLPKGTPLPPLQREKSTLGTLSSSGITFPHRSLSSSPPLPSVLPRQCSLLSFLYISLRTADLPGPALLSGYLKYLQRNAILSGTSSIPPYPSASSSPRSHMGFPDVQTLSPGSQIVSAGGKTPRSRYMASRSCGSTGSAPPDTPPPETGRNDSSR